MDFLSNEFSRQNNQVYIEHVEYMEIVALKYVE